MNFNCFFERFFKKIRYGLVLALLLIYSPAQALNESFSVNFFEPTIDDSDFFTVYSSPTMLKRNFHVGLYLDYAHDPYEFGDNDFNRVSGIVDQLLTANVVGSYGVADWFSIGAVIPVHLFENIDSPLLNLSENNFDMGDIKLVAKFRVLDREKYGVGIALLPFLNIPSSTGTEHFLGDGSIGGGAKVVIDGRIKDRVTIALNIGYNAREGIFDVGGNNLDDQFLLDLGISADILKDKLKVIAEAQVATVAEDFFQERRTTPAEARLGFRYTFAKNHDINLGGGVGISNGISNPDYRVFAGYTYTKRPIKDIEFKEEQKINELNLGDELTLKDKIFFEFDKTVIREISKPTLDKIAAFMKAHPEITKVRIEGHTCDLGRDAYNLKLSQGRAESVVQYLIGQGIDSSRIGTVQGFGEQNPLVPNTDESNRERNRRVQIFIEGLANQ